MKIRLEVKMTQKIMYNFLMNHTYRSFSGIAGILFGIAALGIFITTLGKAESWMSIIYLIFGVWFLLYLPVTLYLRSVKQVKLNPVFKKPLVYMIDETGIVTLQGDQRAEINWDQIIKISETKLSILVYTGKRYSFVLPKDVIGTKYDSLMKLFGEHISPEKMKIKQVNGI